MARNSKNKKIARKNKKLRYRKGGPARLDMRKGGRVALQRGGPRGGRAEEAILGPVVPPVVAPPVLPPVDVPPPVVPPVDAPPVDERKPNEFGFIPPAKDQIVTQAIVPYHNPTTGQTFTAPTGGWTAPAGWVITGSDSDIGAPPPPAPPLPTPEAPSAVPARADAA